MLRKYSAKVNSFGHLIWLVREVFEHDLAVHELAEPGLPDIIARANKDLPLSFIALIAETTALRFLSPP